MRIPAISNILDGSNPNVTKFTIAMLVGLLVGSNATTLYMLRSGCGNQDLQTHDGDGTGRDIRVWQRAVEQRDSVIEVMTRNEEIMASNHDFSIKRHESRESVLLQVVKMAAERRGYENLTLADDGMVYIADDNSWSLWDNRPTHQLLIGPCFTEMESYLSSNWCDQASLKVYDAAGPQFTIDLFNTTMVLERSHNAGHLLGFTQAY